MSRPEQLAKVPQRRLFARMEGTQTPVKRCHSCHGIFTPVLARCGSEELFCSHEFCSASIITSEMLWTMCILDLKVQVQASPSAVYRSPQFTRMWARTRSIAPTNLLPRVGSNPAVFLALGVHQTLQGCPLGFFRLKAYPSACLHHHYCEDDSKWTARSGLSTSGQCACHEKIFTQLAELSRRLSFWDVPRALTSW